MRGIHLQNPACDCSELVLSRLQVAGQGGGKLARGMHFVCAVGRCEYFAYLQDENGRAYRLPRGRLTASGMEQKGL